MNNLKIKKKKHQKKNKNKLLINKWKVAKKDMKKLCKITIKEN